MGDTGVAVRFADNGAEIDVISVMLAARTEQERMAGRSIRTLVDGRHPARDKLDLLAVERPARLRKI